MCITIAQVIGVSLSVFSLGCLVFLRQLTKIKARKKTNRKPIMHVQV